MFKGLTASVERVGRQRQASAVSTPEDRHFPIVQEAGWAAGPVSTGAIPGLLSSQRVGIPTELTRPVVTNMNSLRNSRNLFVVDCENLSAMTASIVVLDVTPSRLVESYQV